MDALKSQTLVNINQNFYAFKRVLQFNTVADCFHQGCWLINTQHHLQNGYMNPATGVTVTVKALIVVILLWFTGQGRPLQAYKTQKHKTEDLSQLDHFFSCIISLLLCRLALKSVRHRDIFTKFCLVLKAASEFCLALLCMLSFSIQYIHTVLYSMFPDPEP